ncbi:MAG: class I tRNA ligase family protein, partial [Pseudomonadota bacterium]
KSKKNVVDPEDIIAQYGADTARWFMLSDSPPERDVEWTAAGAEGAWRFLQRLWRLVDEAADDVAEATDAPADIGEAALTLRKATHRAIDGVTSDIDDFTFNKAVARVYELVNVISKAAAQADEPGMAFARREALRATAQLVNPMTPHFAEEAWARLGGETLLADVDWPVADPSLLKDDVVMMPVQVNGKRRGEIAVAVDADRGAIEAAALADDAVRRFMGDAAPKKVIVVPGRIVNVVI